MDKKVYKYSDIQDKIKEGIDTLANPIAQTISPKGGNVVFQDSLGQNYNTNDGYTIARSINVKDPVVNSIINILKTAAFKTN